MDFKLSTCFKCFPESELKYDLLVKAYHQASVSLNTWVVALEILSSIMVHCLCVYLMAKYLFGD